MKTFRLSALLTALCVPLFSFAAEPAQTPAKPEKGDSKTEAKDAKADDQAKGWRPLFDGKTLKGWRNADFGGNAEAEVTDGAIVLPFAERLAGVAWDGDAKDLPKNNYEIELEARRVQGGDFFCGLTFPVRDSHASLIIGGWGGSLCGISSLDGADAANNETTHIQPFKTGQWYKIRLRVTDDKLQTWIDGDHVIDVTTTGRKIDLRSDIDASKPLGLSSFATTAALKNIRIRALTADEVKQEKAAK